VGSAVDPRGLGYGAAPGALTGHVRLTGGREAGKDGRAGCEAHGAGTGPGAAAPVQPSKVEPLAGAAVEGHRGAAVVGRLEQAVPQSIPAGWRSPCRCQCLTDHGEAGPSHHRERGLRSGRQRWRRLLRIQGHAVANPAPSITATVVSRSSTHADAGDNHGG